jgi:hypothetical protein
MVAVNRKMRVCAKKCLLWAVFVKTLSLSCWLKKTSSNLVFALFFAQISISAQDNSTTPEALHFGPIYDRFPLALREGDRWEAVGPLFAGERSGTGTLFSFSPLFSLYWDSAIPQTEAELGYPILSFDKFGAEYRFQILQVIAFSGGERMRGGEMHRTTLFPIYFHERSSNSNENYTAVFPFYGRINNRLFRDRAFFVLFPLFLRSEKRGVITDNYLFPFFHRRYGAGVSGWQIWPLVGKEHKEVTTTTNTWGEPVLSVGHEKFFALWPIYFNNTLGIGTTNVQKQFVLIPFYTSQVSSNRVSKSYGFPLGYTHTIDHEKKYEERDMPWPFVVFAHGEGKTTKRVWPFFSQAKTPALQSDFYAWPIYKYDAVTADPLHRERTRILLFLYSDLVERNTTNMTALRRRDFWPLFTWRKDHKNHERLQVLSILEPILPNNKSIERVYSPVYSIYRQEKNGVNGNESRSFLWNLYRSERQDESRRASALFGLFQREKNPEGTNWRIFFIPFRTGESSSNSP